MLYYTASSLFTLLTPQKNKNEENKIKNSGCKINGKCHVEEHNPKAVGG